MIHSPARPCETPNTMPRLTLTSGALAGQQFSFSESAVIGRGAYSDIRIDDLSVSRRHAEVIRGSDGVWRLRDLGSSNGILFGGSLIRGELLIEGRVEIVIGEVRATLSVEETPTAPGQRESALPHLLDRVELLSWLATLAARREPPRQLIDQILESLVTRFECRQVGLFLSRPGSDRLVPFAGSSAGKSDWQTSAELAQACRRHVDGVAGGASALEPLGIANPPQCVLAAPVILGGETLGVVVAESDRADTWNPMDRPLAKAFASVLAGFVDTERNSRPERRVAERDLLLARRVQQHFLPQSSLRIDGYQLAESYAPARVVGGDHYDYFRFADDRVGMIIADVSGKAVSAALVMARFGMALRLMASQASTPLDLLVTLNVLLLDELEAGMFVTAQVLALSPQSGEIEIANAGHPSPLLRSAQGSISELAMDPGAALGAGAQTLFRASRFTLEPGACLLLYSDGLNEAENEAGEQFGLERVARAMASASGAASIRDTIQGEMGRFVGAAPANDDLTLLLLSRNGAPVPDLDIFRDFNQ